MTAAAAFSPSDPGFVADPYPAYAALREAGRVLLDERSDHWLVPHHADVSALLRDRRFGRTYLHVATHAEMGRPEEPAYLGPFWYLIRNGMLDREPPDHTRLRRLVAKAFTPRMVERLRDRVQGRVDRLVDGLEAQGWTVLSNRRGRLGDVELAGMDDPHIRRDDPGVAVPPSGDQARLRVGVVHSPYRRSLDAFERNGYGLLLAGHTHGGQVCLPGVGALVTNCDLPRWRARGLSRWGTSWLHVSGGLGTSKFARFRFACRPEASLITVVPRG